MGKDTSARHVDLVAGRAKRVIEGCGFTFWSDISASKVMSYLDGLRADKTDDKGNVTPGISAQTFNFYLAAFKQFCKWMVKDGRASESPVAHLDGLNVRTDRRHDRRALDVEGIRWLLDTTRNGPERYGMAGRERATLYRLTVETGLRAGELASPTRASFDLDGDKPTVTVDAAHSKRRRVDVLPLRPDTAADLRNFLPRKMPDAPAFAMPAKGQLAKMLRADLDAAPVKQSAKATRTDHVTAQAAQGAQDAAGRARTREDRRSCPGPPDRPPARRRRPQGRREGRARLGVLLGAGSLIFSRFVARRCTEGPSGRQRENPCRTRESRDNNGRNANPERWPSG